jgi:hypothetical protein
MASTTGSTRTTTRKAPARKPAAKRTTAARKPAATRTTTSTSTQQKTIAERAVLVPVGAVLETRDQVVQTVAELVDTYSSRASVERQIKRYERRGTTARNRFEREVKKTRTRVERELRQRRTRVERAVKRNRTRLEREAKAFRRDLTKQSRELRTQGEKLVSEAQERIASFA